MKIVICGSMAFAKQMKKAKVFLEKKGHKVHVPPFADHFIKNPNLLDKVHKTGEHHKFKKEHDLIRYYYQKIRKADAILVLNYSKKRIKNYIGGNSFLEMGFAHVLGKKIYLLNSIPKLDLYFDEIKAMEPIILKGNLSRLR